MLKALRRALVPEVKDSRTGALIALSSGGRPRWTPRDYAHLSEAGFGLNPIVYRCVRMIAEAAASTPLAVYEGGLRRNDHALARLLRRPNTEQGGVEFFEAVYAALQTSGNAYVEAAGDAVPEELWALRPDRVKVVPGPSGWPGAYEYGVDGRSVQIGRRADGFMPVMQLKLYHPTDDHYGQSPLEAAAAAIDVHNASGAWNKALLDNSARPSGALVYGAGSGEHLTEEQFATLKAQLEAAHTGTAQAGRPLLLEGGLEWKPMSLSPAEMDFIEGKHAAAREIALAFGVPPQLLGLPGDATYANYREANAAFWRGTILPLVRKMAQSLECWLCPLWPELRLEPDLETVPALAAEREALWARLANADFLSADEKRTLAGVGGV